MNTSAWTQDQLEAITFAKDLGHYQAPPSDALGEYASSPRDIAFEIDALMFCEGTATSPASRRNNAMMLTALLEMLDSNDMPEDERLKAHIAIDQLLDEIAEFGEVVQTPPDDEADDAWVDALISRSTADL